MNKGADLGTGKIVRLTNAQALVVEIVRDLLRAPVDDTDCAIDRALAALGRFTGVDRVSICQMRGGDTLDMTHEWVSEPTAPIMPQTQGFPLAHVANWMPTLGRDEPVWIPDVAALPDDAAEKAPLLAEGVASLLIAPMNDGGKVMGFIGYDHVVAAKRFLAGEVLLLRSVADVVTTILRRRDDARVIAQAQKSLIDARKSLETTLSVLPDLILHVDADGRYVDWHTGHADNLIIPPERFLGKLIEEVLPPHLAAIDRAAMRDAAEFGRSHPRRFESNQAGVDRWVELNVILRPPDNPGERPGYVFVVRDITQERRQTKTIDTLGQLAERTVNLMIITDAERRIEWVNPAFERVTGYSFAEVQGQTAAALLNCPQTDPVVVERIAAATAQGLAARETVLNRSKDGRLYWVDIDIQPLHDDAGSLTGFVTVQTDVTTQKTQTAQQQHLAQEAEQARNRLITAVEALPDAFVYYDADDRLVLCNENYRSFYPLSAPAMQPGMRYCDLLRYSLAQGEHRDAIGREEEWLAEQLALRAAEVGEREQHLSDGRWLRVIDKATPDGGRVGMRCDITALKRAERRLADIIEAADAGTWEWDIPTGNVTINARWAAIVGTTLDALRPLTFAAFQELMHPDDVEPLHHSISRVFAHELENFESEFRLRHHDGHWVWVLSRGKVIVWADRDKPLVMAGVAVDNTDNRNLRNNLRAQREYLARLMETNISGLVVMDENRHIAYMNAEAERLTGIRATDVLTKPFSAIDWEARELDGSLLLPHRTPFALVAATGAPVKDVRFSALRPDGVRRIFSLNAAPVKSGSAGLQVVISVADITEQVDADTALRAALDRAEAANRSKSQFVANMSHEIRTPLNGVLGMAEVLDTALTDPAHKAMIATIRESGETLLGVLNDILDISKIEAGKMEVEEVPFLPSELARKVEALHTIRAQEKGLSFSVMMDVDADRPRIGDIHRILQILHNLVGNAMKFTETGEVTVAFGCKIGRPFTIEVRDTGIGMTPEQVGRVFDDFEQADGTVTRRFGGTGLGLSIVRRLVMLMGGQIDVGSVEGQGTTVRLNLPLASAQQMQETVAPDAIRSLTGLRVLIADDNATNRAILEAMLGGLGVTTTAVVNGREAVDAWAPGRFDVLLLDISMPVMDGISAIRAITGLARESGMLPPPSVAITANAMSHQVKEYLASGFSAHVPKPFRRQDLLETLHRLVGVE